MKPAIDSDMDTSRFWVHHPDSTQAAVHLALQWLAFVYPTSGKYLDATLHDALPYTDDELSQRWRVFLEEKDIDQHVQALQWLSSTLSKEQLPFLIESCWRLLLVNHDLPSHVPLALRLLGRVLKVPEFHILDIGKKVQREIEQQPAEVSRSPLLPEDPRYLDRIEWRLYGMSDPIRRTSNTDDIKPGGRLRLASTFMAGVIVGAGALAFMVWGPPQLGREPVPRMSHQSATEPAASVSERNGSQATTSNDPGTVLNTDTFDQSALPEADSSQASELAPPPESLADEAVTDDAEDSITGDAAGTSQGESAAQNAAAPEPSETDAVVGRDATPVVDEPDVLMSVTASILNVRAAPSTNADIIIKLGEGARVWMEPEGTQGTWNRIRVEGLVGYASSNFMEPVN
ncbi:SH3 domain-containing protein [Saccharospirillum impatiens]|uniref:SH3 domain-containing protein n=1 Tax=Saccharospirillum impatiens TaxID=169438 RepID=UPI0012F8C1E2|nr:SH3 domain-containing protein [Saccharospirillum impatiens]